MLNSVAMHTQSAMAMDSREEPLLDSFVRSAGAIFRAQKSARVMLEDDSVNVIIVPKYKTKYADIRLRAQKYRNASLCVVLQALEMSLLDLYRWIIKNPDVQEAVDEDLNTTGSDLQRTLKRNRCTIPLPQKQISSLYIYRNSTEREVQFNNSYLSSGLFLSTFPQEKIKYLSDNAEPIHFAKQFKYLGNCEFKEVPG